MCNASGPGVVYFVKTIEHKGGLQVPAWKGDAVFSERIVQ